MQSSVSPSIENCRLLTKWGISHLYPRAVFPNEVPSRCRKIMALVHNYWLGYVGVDGHLFTSQTLSIPNLKISGWHAVSKTILNQNFKKTEKPAVQHGKNQLCVTVLKSRLDSHILTWHGAKANISACWLSKEDHHHHPHAWALRPRGTPSLASLRDYCERFTAADGGVEEGGAEDARRGAWLSDKIIERQKEAFVCFVCWERWEIQKSFQKDP